MIKFNSLFMVKIVFNTLNCIMFNFLVNFEFIFLNLGLNSAFFLCMTLMVTTYYSNFGQLVTYTLWLLLMSFGLFPLISPPQLVFATCFFPSFWTNLNLTSLCLHFTLLVFDYDFSLPRSLNSESTL